MSGRPSKLSMLNVEAKAQLLALLRTGMPQSWACRALGLTYDTLWRYRRRAAAGEEPYATFILDVDQARAGYVIERLRALDADGIGAPVGVDRGRGDNRSLMWLLERLFPQDFRLQRRTEHAGKDGAPLEQAPARVIILPAKETD